jgi:8-oxo-dGTP diphosphatase
MYWPAWNSTNPPPAPEIRNLARAVILCGSELLLAYVPAKRFYFLPGGHVEPGESLCSALERELREEVTLPAAFLDNGNYVGLFEHGWTDGARSVHEFNHVWLFQLERTARQHTVESRESHLSFSWVPLRTLATVGFRPDPLAHTLVAWLTGDQSAPLFGSTIKN